MRPKFFKNKNFGRGFKLIYDCHTKLMSVPTDEELSTLGIKREKEEVPYTINHLLQNIVNEYNKSLLKGILIQSSEILTEKGSLETVDALKNGLTHILDLNKEDRVKNITELNEEFWENYLHREKYKGQIIGIPTGFDVFDNHTKGFQKQWLITLSGRNAMNKTWVLIKSVLSAWSKGNNVGIFSCEMSALELQMRIASLACDLPPTKITDATLTEQEKLKLRTFLDNNGEQPFGKLIINDNPQSIADVDALVSEINEQSPLDIIFIDSAYRMKGTGEGDTARQTSIAREAKDLAKKYNIPVFCTVQLNRDFAKANANDKGKEKTTVGGYFVHGTDGWNQDSDIMLMIHQPEAYIPYDYYDLILQKFRHGKGPKHFMLEINLDVPKINQISVEDALTRISGQPSAATQKGEKLFNFSNQVFNSNEVSDALLNSININPDVLEKFHQHREKLKAAENDPSINYEDLFNESQNKEDDNQIGD